MAARPDGKGATLGMSQQQIRSNFICTVAGASRLLILFPFKILRRLGAVLESTKLEVLAEAAERRESPASLAFIAKASGHISYSTCASTLPSPQGIFLGVGNDSPNLRRKKPRNG